MTRAERIEAAARAIWSEMPYAGEIGPIPGHGGLAGIVRRYAEVAVDAALADLGGLDGVERTLVDAANERDRALDRARRAEADLTRARRLREALREIADDPTELLAADAVRARARAALRESEAGT